MRKRPWDQSLISGWKGISDEVELTIAGAQYLAAKGDLPVVVLDNLPIANSAFLRAWRSRRPPRRPRKKEKIWNPAMSDSAPARID